MLVSNNAVMVRRVYDEPLDMDGTRVLVDRIWPRGLSKEMAHLDEWCKQVAPSTALRKWYAHVPERFDEVAYPFHCRVSASSVDLVETRRRPPGPVLWRLGEAGGS